MIKEAYARFFDIVELEDPYEARVGEKGMKRMVQLGFVIGFLTIQPLTGVVFGWTDHNFIIPTGLSANRLVFSTFFLMYLYNKFDLESMKKMDKRYGMELLYYPEKHEEYVTKKWN